MFNYSLGILLSTIIVHKIYNKTGLLTCEVSVIVYNTDMFDFQRIFIPVNEKFKFALICLLFYGVPEFIYICLDNFRDSHLILLLK